MIKVTCQNNTTRKEIIVSESTTLAQAFREAGVSTEYATISLNGHTVPDASATFEDYGITDSCMLLAIIKQHNA